MNYVHTMPELRSRARRYRASINQNPNPNPEPIAPSQQPHLDNNINDNNNNNRKKLTVRTPQQRRTGQNKTKRNTIVAVDDKKNGNNNNIVNVQETTPLKDNEKARVLAEEVAEKKMDEYDSGGRSADKGAGAEDEGSTAPLPEKVKNFIHFLNIFVNLIWMVGINVVKMVEKNEFHFLFVLVVFCVAVEF